MPKVIFGPDEWHQADFTLQLSHSLGNHLNAATGFAALLQQQALAPVCAEYVDHVVESVNNLKSLLDDLIALSRLATGIWPPMPGWILPTMLQKDCLALIAGQAYRYPGQIEIIVAPNAERFHADVTGVKMLVLQLLDGAMATSGGSDFCLVLDTATLRLEIPTAASLPTLTNRLHAPGITALIAAMSGVLSIETMSDYATSVTIRLNGALDPGKQKDTLDGNF